jgi:hypothetical protein
MSKPNIYVPETRTSTGNTVPQPEERPYGAPPVSPTGAPLIPPAYVPYAAAAVAGAAVVQQVAEPGSVVAVIASVVLAVGAVLGIASPGLRKRR